MSISYKMNEQTGTVCVLIKDDGGTLIRRAFAPGEREKLRVFAPTVFEEINGLLTDEMIENYKKSREQRVNVELMKKSPTQEQRMEALENAFEELVTEIIPMMMGEV